MTYEEALEGAKVGQFLKRGLKITGIIHIGSNDGYEVQFYHGMGITNIICFDPNYQAFQRLKEKYPGIQAYNIGLSDKYEDDVPMTVPDGDGQGTTFLKALHPGVAFGNYHTHPDFGHLRRMDASRDLSGCNCIVVDTQGMELQVLKGFGKLIDEVDCAVIECSREPIYEGEAPAHEVVKWMDEHGFDSITPIDAHDDILFVRRK